MNLPHYLSATPIVQSLLGLVLLCFGRKIFWIFVGVIGFFAGAHFAQALVAGQPEMVLFLIAVAVGLLGALLAIFLQRVAVAVAGGVAGGLLAMRLGLLLGFTSQPMEAIWFVVGAVFAAVLITAMFDWALIVLSVVTGAVMVVDPLGQGTQGVAFLMLVIVGFLFQARQLRSRDAER
ncbi:hypothetical protein BH09VER1_BH09VER1_35070 [soil metagenome]